MEILYAGVAPGLAGVQQVNVRIHASTPLGDSRPYVALLTCRVRIGRHLREDSGARSAYGWALHSSVVAVFAHA